MTKKYLGTQYGGWTIDLDSINDGDVIIDGGLGEDISFLEELLKYKKVTIIGVDPTKKSHTYVESKNLSNFHLVKGAIYKTSNTFLKFYTNKNPNHVSESYLPDHSSISNDFYHVNTISLQDLIKEYSPSFIKLDVEGAEYELFNEPIDVKQICVEFHHHCTNKTITDTLNVVNKIKSFGYNVIHSTPNSHEVTFLKDEN